MRNTNTVKITRLNRAGDETVIIPSLACTIQEYKSRLDNNAPMVNFILKRIMCYHSDIVIKQGDLVEDLTTNERYRIETPPYGGKLIKSRMIADLIGNID